MTKKDYELIASAINAERYSTISQGSNQALTALDGLSYVLAGKLAADNQRFDRVRFLAACGVTN